MGDVTTYEIIAMLAVAGWLIFNAGFAAGAAWKRLHQHGEEPASDCDPYVENIARRGRC